MADAENLLCLDELVCNDTYDCRHENGNDALHGIEDTDYRSESDAVEVAAHRREVGSPDGILEEVHDYQPSADAVVIHSSIVFV